MGVSRPLVAVLAAVAVVLAVHGTPDSPVPVVFRNVSKSASLQFVLNNSGSTNKYQIETMPGGVAVLDYDNDGFEDIYFVNGAAIPSLVKTDKSYWNRLYHNNGDGTFTDVTERAGLVAAPPKPWSISAGWFDYDNDGRLDLFVVNYCKWAPNQDPYCGEPKGRRNNNCSFVVVTATVPTAASSSTFPPQ
jgi:hypothetical protein